VDNFVLDTQLASQYLEAHFNEETVVAYMNQERKAKIVAAMKPIMSKYGIKGTFKCTNSSITFTMREGSVDFIADMVEEQHGNTIDKNKLRERYNFSVNPYWYNEHYTGTAKELLDEVLTAMTAADYYDRSDISSDYFDTAYYFNIHVGNWEKPYKVTP
jgi:hypothetical protein